jgi:hypothetical protein
MATVRHFALNLVRTASDKRSIKSRRKIAGWDPDYLDTILSSPARLTWIRSPDAAAPAPSGGGGAPAVPRATPFRPRRTPPFGPATPCGTRWLDAGRRVR